MSKSYCGIKCNSCELNTQCCGCIDSEGRPFGAACVVAQCCKDCKESEWKKNIDELKSQIVLEINSLGIPNMPIVKELYHLKGAYINLEYTLEDGSKVKYWDDDRIYLGCQLEVEGCDKCFGVVADEEHIMVCKYGCGGSDPELVLYRRRQFA